MSQVTTPAVSESLEIDEGQYRETNHRDQFVYPASGPATASNKFLTLSSKRADSFGIDDTGQPIRAIFSRMIPLADKYNSQLMLVNSESTPGALPRTDDKRKPLHISEDFEIENSELVNVRLGERVITKSVIAACRSFGSAWLIQLMARYPPLPDFHNLIADPYHPLAKGSSSSQCVSQVITFTETRLTNRISAYTSTSTSDYHPDEFPRRFRTRCTPRFERNTPTQWRAGRGIPRKNESRNQGGSEGWKSNVGGYANHWVEEDETPHMWLSRLPVSMGHVCEVHREESDRALKDLHADSSKEA
ncbi:hypothetical protein BC629DRAFT_1444045 [Irpex lacteus]|nr:hypothetical protein BC629DRAFT_1444045 [Irpex lacteus]